jgi:hypothetical protein
MCSRRASWNDETKYLLGGVRDIPVPDPTVYFEELGLVLKRKLVVDGVSDGGLPLEKLIGGRKTA